MHCPFCAIEPGERIIENDLVIPRYAGDVPDPRGGIRGAIPHHRLYRRASRENGRSGGRPH